MVVIRLYGVLETFARRTSKFHVHSFDEAIRALFANYPGLRHKIRDMRLSFLVDGRVVTFEDCLRPFKSERIDIMPIVGGTGPAIPIVVGAIMAYGAGTAAAYVGGALALSATATAALATFITNIGIALILSGISQALFKPPKANDTNERPDSAPSYNFNGPVNTITQGNVVPVGFGRMRVGSQVISVNVQTFDVPVPPGPPAPPPPYNPFLGGSAPPSTDTTANNSFQPEIA